MDRKVGRRNSHELKAHARPLPALPPWILNWWNSRLGGRKRKYFGRIVWADKRLQRLHEIWALKMDLASLCHSSFFHCLVSLIDPYVVCWLLTGIPSAFRSVRILEVISFMDVSAPPLAVSKVDSERMHHLDIDTYRFQNRLQLSSISQCRILNVSIDKLIVPGLLSDVISPMRYCLLQSCIFASHSVIPKQSVSRNVVYFTYKALPTSNASSLLPELAVTAT